MGQHFKPGQTVRRTGSKNRGVVKGGVYVVSWSTPEKNAEQRVQLHGHNGRFFHTDQFELVQDVDTEQIATLAALAAFAPKSRPEPVPDYTLRPDTFAEPELKPTNPKDAIGNRKLQLGLLPFAFQAEAALALTDGKYKYGAHNWAIGGVRSSIYIDAALRHVARYNAGQELDPDSGVHNLGHAAACIAILLDARERGVLNDDRPPALDSEALLMLQDSCNALTGRLIDGHVAAGRAPRHWTIADCPGCDNAE